MSWPRWHRPYFPIREVLSTASDYISDLDWLQPVVEIWYLCGQPTRFLVMAIWNHTGRIGWLVAVD